MSIFSAENIVKRYAAHTALDQVSVEVPRQSVFGLLGPNGAGKTSLIRILNQITAPDEGIITFDGEPLQPHHVEQIGYLPEERGLYKKMKVGEQAMYLAQLKGMNKREAKKELKAWFEKFEIDAWWGKKVEELSKGMAQKIQFITTVLHRPKLLILDEPFSGFDPINTNLVKSEILKLRDEGATILLSTHNMGSVEEICDHIALINKSKKVLDGPMNAVKEKYRSYTYELKFKGNVIGFTNALWTGFELLESSENEGTNTAKVRLLHNNTLNNLLETVLPHVAIESVHEIIPSMNDIFISAVNEQNPTDEQDSTDH